MSTAEWNIYRTSGYTAWTPTLMAGSPGRICQLLIPAAASTRPTNRTDYGTSWRAFDANGNGCLSSDNLEHDDLVELRYANSNSVLNGSAWPW